MTDFSPSKAQAIHLRTPDSKSRAFKSPKNSTSKPQNTSPFIQNKQQIEARQQNLVSDMWAVSPICSRLQEHINMITSTNFKENRFLASPMPCQNLFVMSTPIMDYRLGSTSHTIKNQNSNGSGYDMTMENTAKDTRQHQETGLCKTPDMVRKFNEDEGTSQFKMTGNLMQVAQADNSNSNQMVIGVEQQDGQSYPQFGRQISAHFPNQSDDEDDESESQSMVMMPGNAHPMNAAYYEQMVHQKLRRDHPINSFRYCNKPRSLHHGNSMNSQKPAQRNYMINEHGQLERVIRKRKRKSSDQLKTLMREFERNPGWSKETLLEVSKKTGLSEAQVYKWGWDQKRKKYGDDAVMFIEGMAPPTDGKGDYGNFTDDEDDELNESVEPRKEQRGNKKGNFFQNQVGTRGLSLFEDPQLIEQIQRELKEENEKIEEKLKKPLAPKNEPESEAPKRSSTRKQEVSVAPLQSKELVKKRDVKSKDKEDAKSHHNKENMAPSSKNSKKPEVVVSRQPLKDVAARKSRDVRVLRKHNRL